MLSICDIVLNHTANESQWLQEHPECSYNMINSPYMKAAYLLDIALYNFSFEVANGAWELKGVPKLISNDDNLEVRTKLDLPSILNTSQINRQSIFLNVY